MNDWASEELVSIDLGDGRLNTRASAILRAFSENTQSSIPEAFSSFADMKACYRFFSNNNVNRHKLLAPHVEATVKRIQNHPVVLLISDSSSLDFSGKSSIEGMGRIRSEYSRGLWVHPTLAVAPDRLCLGVVDTEIWTRDLIIKRELGKIIDKKNIQDKESHKWIKSYHSACKLAQLCPKTQIINVTDREGDIMELLIEVCKEKKKTIFADIIVRSSHNRISKEGESLQDKLKESPSLGKIEFVLPTGRKREPRKIVQTVKAIEFSPRKKWFNHEYLAETTINVVTAVEENPPSGSKAVEWTFLTTLPIKSYEEAHKVIEYYLSRWQIETYFKVLKSGCKIEDNCLKTRERMENLIAMYMILAWRVMYLMSLSRTCPEKPCKQIFPEEVCKLIDQKFDKAKKSTTIGEMVTLIARLGGYPARKNDPPPGPKVIWKGLKKLMNYMEVIEVLQANGRA